MSDRNLFRRGEVWWLRTTVNGVEHRESLRCRDAKNARAKRDQRLAEIEAAKVSGPRRPWKEAVAAYLEHAADNIAASTARRYAVSLLEVEPFFCDYDIAAIDGKSVMAMIAGRRAIGVTNATIRRDLTAVSQVLAYAEAQDWREGNPALAKRKTVRERRDPITLPEDASITIVFARCNAKVRALAQAALLTGCRQDELVTATWRNFDTRARQLTVVGKGNKRRTLSLSEAATAHFSAQPRALKCDLIWWRQDGDEAVRLSDVASYFARVSERCEAAAEKAGKPFRRFRFHDLRHLYAVRELRAGRGLYDLQKHLGHTSIQVTEMYLEFLTPEQAQKVKEKMA